MIALFCKVYSTYELRRVQLEEYSRALAVCMIISSIVLGIFARLSMTKAALGFSIGVNILMRDELQGLNGLKGETAKLKAQNLKLFQTTETLNVHNMELRNIDAAMRSKVIQLDKLKQELDESTERLNYVTEELQRSAERLVRVSEQFTLLFEKFSSLSESLAGTDQNLFESVNYIKNILNRGQFTMGGTISCSLGALQQSPLVF